jgi:hypothetical protein
MPSQDDHFDSVLLAVFISGFILGMSIQTYMDY